MVKKYYFIPYAFTAQLSIWQQFWLGQSESAFMCVSGIYSECASQEQTDTEIISQGGGFVKRVFFDDMENTYYECVGYVLEALESQMPNVLPSEVLVFDNAENFVIWRIENNYV